VIVREGRCLLIRRAAGVPQPGFWAPVGGTVEPGETEAAAVVREAREEVGLEVRPVRKVWENVSSSGTFDLHWWLAEPVGGRLAPDPREVAGTRWCDTEAYFALDRTFSGDHEFFRSVLPGLLGEPDRDGQR
jgi:ADP-ribose pyrophosphatase YjhB (NUDIX family)